MYTTPAAAVGALRVIGVRDEPLLSHPDPSLSLGDAALYPCVDYAIFKAKRFKVLLNLKV